MISIYKIKFRKTSVVYFFITINSITMVAGRIVQFFGFLIKLVARSSDAIDTKDISKIAYI